METRYIAHIVIEAVTPLKVGSNASDFLQDSPVQKDWNNLPMILGTSIAGVLRKEFNKSIVDDVFGKENGSKVIISNALLLNENDNVSEDLLLDKSDFLKLFDNLPIREHTAITDKGVVKDNSKFDEEVVYAGSRFKFSIELIESEKEVFENLLSLLSSVSFRLGGGSTKGFGKLKIKEIKTDTFDLENYENYSSSLNHQLTHSHSINKPESNYTTYTLKITPDDFFMFGSGFGDSDADMTPIYEQVVDYKNAKLSDKKVLIPTSSIKGALSHRVAFHYNKYLLENDKEADYKKIGEKNEAVKTIFGHKKESVNINGEDKELGQKGKILISDCLKENKEQIKTFDHVSIDRFTGGAIDGALFQEKTIAQKDEWSIEILLENSVEQEYIDAFESSLKDICSGMLPLGGMTTKGHGVFSGKVFKDGVELKDENNTN